jgi:phosphohistidine phosphatase
MTGMDRTLVVLRHAKSAWPEGVEDVHRPLLPRGRRDAPVAGRWLREHVPGIAAVACSPALRTLQTWQLVQAELGVEPEFRAVPRIYDASVRDLLAVVAELPADAGTALLIGHNPGLSELVEELSGERLVLSTCAIAVLRATDDWITVDRDWASLVDSATPRG